MKNLLTFLSMLMGSFLSFAQNDTLQDLGQQIPVDQTVTIGQLDNGLTYYLRENDKPEDKIEFRLVLNAGSILEDEDQLGLAHFIEHMAFNGSENFEKNDLIDYLQSVGVEFGPDLNAYTSFDETVYMLPIPTEDSAVVNRGLLVLSDWAGRLTFDEEEIDKERGVVLEEWRIGRGADQRMRDEWFPVLYKNSRYAERLPIGDNEVIENASYETIRQFYEDWYRPDLMAVIAVGDFETEEMLGKIRAAFGSLENPGSPRDRQEYEVPGHEETYVVTARDEEAAFTNVRLYYKQPDVQMTELKDLKADMINTLYAQMFNQRLDELTRKENPPFIQAWAGYYSIARTRNSYISSALVGEDQILTGLRAVVTENERVKRYGFTAGELDRAKKNLLKRYEQQLKERDKTESKRYVSEYIRHFLDDEPIPGVQFEADFARQVLPDIALADVNSRAAQWIRDDNRVVVITAPEKESVTIPSEEEILGILKDVEGDSIAPYADILNDAELIAQLPKPGAIVSESKNETLDINFWTLENGAKVIWKSTDFKNDQILMTAYSWGGTSLYPDEEYYSASYASTAISQGGVGSFSPTDLEKLLADKVVNISQFINDTQEGLRGSASPEDLELLYQLMYLHLADPRKDETLFNAYLSRLKMVLPNLMSNPDYFFQDQVAEVMSQGHLRGGGLPTVEELEAVNFERAYEIYTERFTSAGDFTFVFVGNIEEAQLRQFTETYLAGLPAGEREQYQDVGLRPPSGLVEKTFVKGKDPKSRVKLTFTGEVPFSVQENYEINTLCEVLSNRLTDVIREEKSGVYSVSAWGDLQKHPYESYEINISFPCGPENTESLISDVLNEIKKVQEEGPTQEDLDKVKQAQRQNRKEGLEKNGYWLGQIKTYDMLGLNLENFYDYDQRVENVTLADIQQTARKYLNSKERIELVLMPEVVEE